MFNKLVKLFKRKRTNFCKDCVSCEPDRAGSEFSKCLHCAHTKEDNNYLVTGIKQYLFCSSARISTGKHCPHHSPINKQEHKEHSDDA